MRRQLTCMAAAVLLAATASGQQGRMWERMQRMDTDGDGAISREEFTGPVRIFDRLDADGDGAITQEEFGGKVKEDQVPGEDHFAAMDGNGDGRITSDEVIDFFLEVDADEDGGATRAEYDEFMKRRARQSARRSHHRDDRPSGAAIGEPAPDFDLPLLDDGRQETEETVKLSELVGQPTLLIFGSYT